ncbi:Box C/D snoRNA accumulation [Vermiconidia calcicola]|uniref:Box C/D snoRNA accumulation n=1 Tax=Vermiconidia calcicola TaxID=1690605 RepID=A0ACC3NQB4_9PEZI|nr:Box C/D snoRNA accumulation [Vermiconidia calcicola]
MERTLLSELCTLCHTDKPKYRCPRCKAQTCSLSCYKRHQQRASCSGKRDPTTYVKKSQWATPAGIDHDYNYLKSVERTIDGSSQDVHSRGIGVDATSSKGAHRAWQPQSGLQKYLNRNQITVDRAPVGMSRQKSNQTRVTKSGKVMWTVEWVYASGVHDVQNDCPESTSVQDLYSAFQAEKRNAQKRRLAVLRADLDCRGVKRKRADAQKGPSADPVGRVPRKVVEHLHDLKAKAEVQSSVETEVDSAAESMQTGVVAEHRQDETASQALNSISEGVSSEHEIADTGDNGEARCSDAPDPKTNPEEVEDGASSDGSASPVRIIAEKSETPLREGQVRFGDASDDGPPKASSQRNNSEHDYYLLKPATSSKCIVVIPLQPQATLTEALIGHIVQEFPTIYVLPAAPNTLPADFMLEAEYLHMVARSARSQVRPGTTNSAATAGNHTREGHSSRNQDRELDAKSILDMLKRDIAR